MDSGKQINISAPSSPENVGDDHLEERSMEEDDHTGVGRSYECNFCKRGFTNAQALGGHMNIHRKDKAKAKQKNQEPHQPSISNIRRPGEIYSHIPYQVPPLDHQHQEQNLNYDMSIGGQGSHNMYPPSSNPNFQTENLHRLRLEQYRYGYDHENLTLGIGAKPFVEEDDYDDDAKDNEIDLELRLGHDP